MKKNKFIYIKTDFYLFIFIIYLFIDIFRYFGNLVFIAIYYHSCGIYLYYYTGKKQSI